MLPSVLRMLVIPLLVAGLGIWLKLPVLILIFAVTAVLMLGAGRMHP